MKIMAYTNRKAYSQDLRRYVNGTELIAMVRAGETLKFENTYGEDLTQERLCNLITVWVKGELMKKSTPELHGLLKELVTKEGDFHLGHITAQKCNSASAR